MTKITDDDDYIAVAAEPLRPFLIEWRERLARALPDTEEIVAYNLPGCWIGKIDDGGLHRIQQAMRPLLVPGRNQAPCRGHNCGRSQGNQDRRHFLTNPANA